MSKELTLLVARWLLLRVFSCLAIMFIKHVPPFSNNFMNFWLIICVYMIQIIVFTLQKQIQAFDGATINNIAVNLIDFYCIMKTISLVYKWLYLLFYLYLLARKYKYIKTIFAAIIYIPSLKIYILTSFSCWSAASLLLNLFSFISHDKQTN